MDLTHQKRKDAVKETETAREKGKKKTEQNIEANLSIASDGTPTVELMSELLPTPPPTARYPGLK
jgi:hypothetical protein